MEYRRHSQFRRALVYAEVPLVRIGLRRKQKLQPHETLLAKPVDHLTPTAGLHIHVAERYDQAAELPATRQNRGVALFARAA